MVTGGHDPCRKTAVDSVGRILYEPSPLARAKLAVPSTTEPSMGFPDFREPVSAWTHFLWMWLAIPGTVLLWRRSRGDRAKQWSLLVFGCGLIFCYLGSTLFHGVHPPEQVRRLCTLDHIGIYLLIAGSYTPAVVVLLGGWWKWIMLGMAWVLAGAGITLRLTAEHVPASV